MVEKIIIMAIIAMGMRGISSGADFNAWTRKMKITFSGYDRNETLTNFPALVVLNTNLTDFSYADFASENGFDLRFASASGAELNYEIEQWDTNGSSYFWVQVPALSNSSDYIWAYWKNSGQTNRQAYTTNGATWAATYRAVWHFSITNSPTNLLESTSNKYNLTKMDGATGLVASTTNALIAKGENFPVLDELVSAKIGGTSSSNLILKTTNQPFTVTSWSCPASLVTNDYARRIFALSRGSGTSALILGYDNTNKVYLWRYNGTAGSAVRSSTAIASNTWHHVSATYDGANFVLYVDGKSEATVADNLVKGSSSTFFSDTPTVGNAVSPAAGTKVNFVGIMDDIQLCDTALSSNRIWACWLNTASNSAFITYSGETEINQGPLVRGW